MKVWITEHEYNLFKVGAKAVAYTEQPVMLETREILIMNNELIEHIGNHRIIILKKC